MPYTDNPVANPLDAVRFYVGDTDTTNQQLSDNEIAALLFDEGQSTRRAAARAAEILAAKYARDIDKSVGNLSISASARYTHYRELAVRLWAKATTATVAPWAGGLSVADKDTREADTDRVQPAFSREMMDYPPYAGITSNDTDELLG